MRVRVLAFARLRDVLGFGERDIDVPSGATLDALWSQIVAQIPAMHDFRASTRFARNGTLASASTLLSDGDEIALLPPVGGG